MTLCKTADEARAVLGRVAVDVLNSPNGRAMLERVYKKITVEWVTEYEGGPEPFPYWEVSW